MIYFIRHGETDFNKQKKIQGHLDIPLNATGIAQAEKARDELEKIQFDVIYSSPLSRAKKTAEIINEKQNAMIVFDDRLKEKHCGKVEGECYKDWTEEMFRQFHEMPEIFFAEPIMHFCARVGEVLKEIENLDKNVLIVSHGGVYRAIYRYINNLQNLDFDMKILNNAEPCRVK